MCQKNRLSATAEAFTVMPDTPHVRHMAARFNDDGVTAL
jgi:hypothetical protein